MKQTGSCLSNSHASRPRAAGFRPPSLLALLAAATLLTACPPKKGPNFWWMLGLGSSPSGGGTASFTVGGTVTGLVGSGLRLMNNGGEEISVSADGPFGFHTTVGDGAAYDVQVSGQPTGPVQTCTASNNTGVIASASVGTVAVVCSTHTYTVGGTVSGLLGSGLRLTNNGGDEISIAGDGSFTFPTAIADGGGYNVQVSAHPASLSQTCTATSNTGMLAGSNVTTVSILCATNSFTVGGTVTGLDGTGLQLKNNGGDYLTITTNGTFTFSTAIADGAAFDVLVHQQPTGLSQTCTPATNSGTVAGGNVTTVTIHCVTNTFTVGGTVTGLSGTGLKLTNNGGGEISVTGTGSVPFTFAASLVDGSAYDVQVSAQPASPGQVCVATNNTGNLAGANVGSVTITCTTNTYTIGGTVSGLSGSGLQLKNNGGDALAISGNGSFTFATPIDDGQAYNVTVSAQPTGPTQSCTVTSNSGTVVGANVTSVSVACVAGYTLGGRVSGLVGTLVLQNNLGDNKTITTDGAFAFDTALVSGSAYSVTVLSKPPAQTCNVANGSGTMGSTPVTNVYVYCFTTGDTTKPTVVSSTPANAAPSVSPLGATITVVFSEPMRVGLVPTLTTEAYNGSAWTAIPNTGTTMVWTDATTLTITLSWVRFPEMTQLRWTLAAANLQDAAGNTIAANVQQTFTTGLHYPNPFAVADTGQTTCYNASAVQVCDTAGWLGQDAYYPNSPNARSFTGPTAHGTYTSDYTTTDNVTGLVWASCTNGLSGATCTGTASTFTWYNAVNACASRNTANGGAGYAGRTNWRLPTVRELETLPNYGVYNPAIDTAAFPATVSNYYWASTTYAPSVSYAWSVNFGNGYVYSAGKTPSYPVRCVAAP